jgi:CO dehydrogenase/acetyl-CoA synthase epsilon subunit
MRQNNLARKKMQLKVLAEKLQRLVRYHRLEAGAQIEKLIHKIKSLAQDLADVLSHTALKKILGAAAVLVGISFSNQANAQMFDSPVRNPFGLKSANGLAFPGFADLDGDGDQDLLVGEYYGVMKYFQNTGTSLNPNFIAPLANPFGLTSTNSVAFPAFADLDGDGDLDLLVGETYGAMQYFRNMGSVSNPQFAAPLTNPFGLDSTYNLSAPAFADLDGDGDMDLLVGEYYGAMKYFMNTGSDSVPQFAAPLENPFGLVSTYDFAFPAFADLDADGDLDLLVGEYYGTMQYFQNTGSALAPQFEPPLANPFGLEATYYYAFPAFADLDGDGDSDLLVGEYEGVMQYFKNETVIGIAELSQAFDLKLFPNPVSNILNIESEETISKIEVFNTLGVNVMTVENQVSHVSLHHLSPGIYMVKVTSDLGNFTTQKILKQ